MTSTDPPILGKPLAQSASEGPIAAHLRTLAGQARAQLLLQRTGRILAIALAAALVWGFLDFWLRFPAPVRFIAWFLGLAALVWQVRRHLVPAWKFRPTPTALALRIESATGADAGLRHLLASGLELGRPSGAEAPGPVERSLRTAAASTAESKFAPARAGVGILRPDRLLRILAALVAVAAPILALQFTAPTLSRIGTLRVLAP